LIFCINDGGCSLVCSINPFLELEIEKRNAAIHYHIVDVYYFDLKEEDEDGDRYRYRYRS
jgi:hypothetical protein